MRIQEKEQTDEPGNFTTDESRAVRERLNKDQFLKWHASTFSPDGHILTTVVIRPWISTGNLRQVLFDPPSP
jgi:hypothetical protein